MVKGLLCLALPVVMFSGWHKDEHKLRIGKDFTERVAGLSFDMVYVEGGTFSMGATAEQGSDHAGEEKPVRPVTLSDYYIGRFEVTQELWEKVTGTTLEEQRDKALYGDGLPGEGSDYPMYYVTWEDALAFCDELSLLTGRKYVLPTEAQWEYAARGGVKSRGYRYSGSDEIGDVAWYDGNCGERYASAPIGTKKPNELGIHDMTGNVLEWCSDWYGDYGGVAETDPAGPASGSGRVLRGGSWQIEARGCRVAHRYYNCPHCCYDTYGFRVVLLP